MTPFDLDPDYLRQVAGTLWLIVVGVTLLALSSLTVLLPIFIWRIWVWTRGTCQETARLNRKLDQLMTWLITVRREEMAAREGRSEEDVFSFETLQGGTPAPDTEKPPFAAGGEEAEGETGGDFIFPAQAVPSAEGEGEGEAGSLSCPYCALPLERDPDSGGYPVRCPFCYSPLDRS